MKSAWFSKTLLLMVLSVSLFACSDKHASTVTPDPVVAGKGGLATLRVTVQHTGVNVDSGMVYIEYNSQVPPKDDKYDDSAKIYYVEGTPLALFPDMKQGNYFLYGKGWDIIRSATVSGSRPYVIPAEAKAGLNNLILQVY